MNLEIGNIFISFFPKECIFSIVFIFHRLYRCISSEYIFYLSWKYFYFLHMRRTKLHLCLLFPQNSPSSLLALICYSGLPSLLADFHYSRMHTHLAISSLSRGRRNNVFVPQRKCCSCSLVVQNYIHHDIGTSFDGFCP